MTRADSRVNPINEPLTQNDPAPPRRLLILRGVFWNSASQVFVAALNFISMLVLVRVISPAEYGRAAAAGGILAVINCFSSGYFISQAIQLAEHEEPDWQAHWRAGFYFQLLLMLVCNGVAAVAWYFPSYRPLAPLLHLASIGLLLDWPNQLSLVMLRREMNFRALRLVQAVGSLITMIVSVILGVQGVGAVALILGSNVLHGLPLGWHLLAIRRWRPAGGWWRWPRWTAYRAPLRFGSQMSASAVLAAARGALEGLILPRALGFEAMGLLNRAQVLFATTFGRVNGMVVETIYPLLPRSANDPAQFARHATLFVQVMLLVSIPGAVFVGLEGPALSRLVYGQKWVAADALIWPGTLFAWGTAALMVFGIVLLSANRLRTSLLVNIFVAMLALPALAAAVRTGARETYAWACAGGQLMSVMLVMRLAAPLLEKRWLAHGIWSALVPALFGTVAVMALDFVRAPLAAKLALSAVAYGVVVIVAMRLLFADALRPVVIRLPAGPIFAKWLKL